VKITTTKYDKLNAKSLELQLFYQIKTIDLENNNK